MKNVTEMNDTEIEQFDFSQLAGKEMKHVTEMNDTEIEQLAEQKLLKLNKDRANLIKFDSKAAAEFVETCVDKEIYKVLKRAVKSHETKLRKTVSSIEFWSDLTRIQDWVTEVSSRCLSDADLHKFYLDELEKLQAKM